MRRSIAILLAATVMFGCSHLATAARPISLWLIESESAKVYLLGSIHVMRDDMYPLPAPVEQAFEGSDVTVFEVDMQAAGGVNAAQLMREKGVYPAGKSIYTELSEETLQLLNSYCSDNGMSLADFERVRPWMIAVNIAMLELNKLGFDAGKGIDLHYQRKARAAGKPVRALETFEEQIELLSSEPAALQELSLKLALEHRDEVPAFIKQLIDAWSSGRADLMYQVSAADYKRHPDLMAQFERLLDDRNARMAIQISSFLDNEDQTYFVVIGALHMGGEQGLLRLLNQHYQVTQITYSGE